MSARRRKGNYLLDKAMKTDEKETRDRAELTWTASFPDGDRNREMEVVATRDGLCVDEYQTISWDWILQAKRKALAS